MARRERLDVVVRTCLSHSMHERLMQRLTPQSSESEVIRDCVAESLAREETLRNDDQAGAVEHSQEGPDTAGPAEFAMYFVYVNDRVNAILNTREEAEEHVRHIGRGEIRVGRSTQKRAGSSNLYSMS